MHPPGPSLEITTSITSTTCPRPTLALRFSGGYVSDREKRAIVYQTAALLERRLIQQGGDFSVVVDIAAHAVSLDLAARNENDILNAEDLLRWAAGRVKAELRKRWEAERR